MASVNIPIISEFDAKGTQRAVKEFQSLEGASAKASFAIKKAAVPAAAAIAGIATALTLATKAAMEDQAEQAQLALTLENVTGASDAQVKATEDQISAMSRASGIADTDYRKALENLVRGTKDVEVAMNDMNLVMDISTATGTDSATVADALAKAYQGNFKALRSLSPEMAAMIKEGASLEEVMAVLGGTFGGATAAAADTAAGKFKILGNQLAETKESIGAALLPVVEAVLPYLEKFANWAQDNPEAFLFIAGAIGLVAAAIVATNIAMALNPFSLIAIGVGLLVAGLVIAYKKFEWFSSGIKAVINGIIGIFEFWANSWIKVINAIIKGYNALPLLPDIGLITEIKIGRVGGEEATAGGGMNIPKMAKGGIVNSATLAIIGEKGPEAVVPLNGRNSGMGNYTININGGLGSSAEIGTAVVNAIRAFNRQNGPANIAVA
tara:strand:- start:141 stop:1460 length:1320 start_codon:yes stop_codon:yes gene_type:complete